MALFFPKATGEQAQGSNERGTHFFEEESGEISSLILVITSHFGGAREGDWVQSKVLHCPFDACGPMGLRVSMHRAAVVYFMSLKFILRHIIHLLVDVGNLEIPVL